ncbi:translation initiation factor eIF-1A [Cryptococcus depauperatus CBS 7841]|uniref:Translation initiation factor eIF-1A n=1 Tax=Cryptococcus depauperatus CBS 7841 TaxID=1295531 RepID=A0AAJ8JRT1_9TREE
MPKNKGKGGKNNRRGKKEDGENKRELVFKEDGQEYAQVVKMLGNGRLEAKCQDGESRLAQIRGQMRKKVWIVVGDIILLSLRDFQDDRADTFNLLKARRVQLVMVKKEELNLRRLILTTSSLLACFVSTLHASRHPI